jgi:hypothetical protein
MAQMSRGEPFSVPDPLADAWDEMVRVNRRLQAKNDPLAEVAVTASPKALPQRAAGSIDTNLSYGPVTLDQIIVAGAKTHALGDEKVRGELPEPQEQRWIAHGLFTDYQGKIPSGTAASVAGPFDAIIHTHPSNWSQPWPGEGDYGHTKPVYGIVGSRVWVVPPGSRSFYWLK